MCIALRHQRQEEIMSELVDEVDAAFASDTLIDELGFVMSLPPPNVILVEHKLGLSIKVLKPLFTYAATAFHTLLHQIRDGNKTLNDPTVTKDILRYTRAVLLVRGDMPMAYNMRKKILGQHESQSVVCIMQELSFLKVLFTKHPKSPSSWEHRRWCLRQLFGMKDGILQTKVSFTDADMQEELDLCTNMAEIYPKNYYAWMHRRWLLLHMTLKQLNDELSFTYAWLVSHVSDHSASNHRDQVIHDIMEYLEVNGDDKYATGTSIDDADVIGIPTFILSRIEVITTHGGETSNDFQPLQHILSSDGNNKANHIVGIRPSQLVFIESVFIESGMLIVHRPGHETLWYHRRNILNMYQAILFKVFHMQWHVSLSQSTQLSFLTKDLVLSSLGENLLDIDKLMSIGINVQAYHQQTGQSTKRNHNMQNLLHLVNQFHDHNNSSSSPPPPPPVSQLLSWIIQWCLDDVQFVAMCVDMKTSWGYPEQRMMALRYHCYLLFMMTKSHMQSPLSLSFQPSSSDQISEPQLTHTTTTNTTAITSTPHSSILFDFKIILTNSLHTAALKLSQEDSMDRLWHNLIQR